MLSNLGGTRWFFIKKKIETQIKPERILTWVDG